MTQKGLNMIDERAREDALRRLAQHIQVIATSDALFAEDFQRALDETLSVYEPVAMYGGPNNYTPNVWTPPDWAKK